MKNFFKVLKKTPKLSYTEEIDDNSDELPPRYRHPRDGLRRTRTWLYALMHYLSLSLHMS